MMHLRLRATVMARWPSFCWQADPLQFRSQQTTSLLPHHVSDRILCVPLMLMLPLALLACLLAAGQLCP